MTEPSEQRITAVLALFAIGLMFVITAVFLNHWMTWATGALIIRFAMWPGEE